MVKNPPFITKVVNANTKETACRTTIPKEIRDKFDLNASDMLIWKIIDEKIILEKLVL